MPITPRPTYMHSVNVLRLSVCAVILLCSGTALGQNEDKAKEFVYYSPAYHIDQIYKSMKGPTSTEKVFIHEAAVPELLWVTAMHAQMVDATDGSPARQDFMCHMNLDLDKGQLNPKAVQFTRQMGRIVTLSQGQLAMALPKGFGIPVYSNEPLLMETQVLNLNMQDIDADIQQKIIITYIRDKDLDEPLIPLFTVGAQGMVLVEGHNSYFEIDEESPALHGPGCSLGETASDVKYSDLKTGSKFTGHWVLKPGKEVNSTSTTVFMNLPYDTTLHYVEVHAHPFAQYLELIDRTANTTVFKSYAKNFEDRLGLANVDHFTSIEGIPVYKDHEYELVSVYDNTTTQNHDAMAHMVLFLRDQHYQKR